MSYSGVLRSRHDEGENPNSKDLGKNGCEKKPTPTKKEVVVRGPFRSRSCWRTRWALTEMGQRQGGYFSCAFERISGEIPRGPLHDDPWRATLQRQRVRLG
jgi:hypothetical protein